MLNEVKKQKRDFSLVLIAMILAIGIFIVDSFLPVGYNVSLAYIAGVVLFLWVNEQRYLIIYSVLTSVLTLVDFFISPPGGNLAYGSFNKAFTVVGLWVGVLVVRRHFLAQKARNKNQQQLDALYEAATEAIIVSDSQGNIVMANPQSHRLFGYKNNELIGMKIEQLLPDQFRDKHVHYRDDFMENPQSRAMGMGRDLFAKKKDDSIFPVEISLSYFRQENELFVISFVIDITKRKEAENELLHAKGALEKYASALKNSNRELEQFAYVASHDLQEPLRKIMAFGDRLKRKEAENISEDSLDYLNRMLNAADRMKNLINDLLSFSRVTSRGRPFEKVDLNQIANEVITDLEVAIERSNAKVELEKLPVIDADPLQMRQLLQNLISNALKFNAPGSTPQVHVFSEQEFDQQVRLHVQDNGVGFDEKYLDRIFTIFQRLDGQNFEGSGVGLAICKKIVQRHSGEITARSAIGKGADFIITLPVKQRSIE